MWADGRVLTTQGQGLHRPLRRTVGDHEGDAARHAHGGRGQRQAPLLGVLASPGLDRLVQRHDVVVLERFAAVLVGALVLASCNGIDSYTRVVDRPIDQVREALADLDISAQPGAPGTDASRSGGVLPVFRLETAENAMTWFVMSGDKVAVTMTAMLEPINDGKATRVTTKVARGDAPDDFVSPAFRSVGLTLGLFSMAVEDELNELVTPEGNPADCAVLMQRFEDENLSDTDRRTQTSGLDATSDVAKTVMRLNAMEAELRRNGCPLNSGYEARSVDSQMAPAEPLEFSRPADPSSYGKPMVDPMGRPVERP